MISILEKSDCCGCSACVSECPQNAIVMIDDNEGFLYPQVDVNKCILCGICNSVCPMSDKSKQKTKNNRSLYIAAQNKNEKVRRNSTSGGAFSLIADYVLSKDGVVFGAGFDSEMLVCHKCAENEEAIKELRGSKYVQSRMDDTIQKVGEFIKNRKYVLFSGTPCQVYGLKNAIGENKYLITMDFLCLGVSSPEMYACWIRFLQRKYKEKVSKVEFRNKSFGYYVSNVRVTFESGRYIQQNYDSKSYPRTFFESYNVRPSCYKCMFREKPRVSDFTVGDLIDSSNMLQIKDDDGGSSKLWVHTEKAKEILKTIQHQMRYQIIDNNCSNILGGKSIQMVMPPDRKDFFIDAMQYDYEKWITKWMPNNLKGQVISVSRVVINCFPFRKIIFKKMRKFQANRFEKNQRLFN